MNGNWTRFGIAAAIVAVVGYFGVWQWEIERVEVPAGKFLVLIHKWGANLEPDQIIAPDEWHKGVQLQTLAEGRHFINPIFWRYELHDMIHVPPGQCLVKVRKFGDPLPPGETLASEDENDPLKGTRGVLRQVLGPGSYRINPYAYNVSEKGKFVEVKANSVGVRTLKVGKDPTELTAAEWPEHYVVPDGYRGVQKETMPPGTYYINPYVESIHTVEARSHRVKLTDIEFPSRDGFLLKPGVVVEYRAQPEKAPELMVRLTDEGQLHQEDETEAEQANNEILQKVILPLIRGYSRIEGSGFYARDFILTAQPPKDGATATSVTREANAREKLQTALLEKVRPQCEELGVEIRAITLAELRPPSELSDQISQRELAAVELDKNKVKLREYKAEQDLMSKQALKEQAKLKVEAETRLLQAKTKADQLKQVAESQLKQELENAQLKLDASRKQAEATLARGKAEADVITLENQAEISSLRKSMQGFAGVQAFAQYQLLQKIAPNLREVFASDDSEFSKLFSHYMTPPTTPGARPLPPPTSVTDPSAISDTTLSK